MQPRMTSEEAEENAQVIEDLFTELMALRKLHDDLASLDALETKVPRVSEALARIVFVNLLDMATEQNLKGDNTGLLPDVHMIREWEYMDTARLIMAINDGMSAMVRDLATLRAQGGLGGRLGRELDVKRFRMAWETLAPRLIKRDGATVIVEEGEGGEVGIRVFFEPPMSNPFKVKDEEFDEAMDALTPAQVAVGNMLSVAFTRQAKQEGPPKAEDL